jgi:hypothetical protein
MVIKVWYVNGQLLFSDLDGSSSTETNAWLRTSTIRSVLGYIMNRMRCWRMDLRLLKILSYLYKPREVPQRYSVNLKGLSGHCGAVALALAIWPRRLNILKYWRQHLPETCGSHQHGPEKGRGVRPESMTWQRQHSLQGATMVTVL